MSKQLFLAAALLALTGAARAETHCGEFTRDLSAVAEICAYHEGYAPFLIDGGWGFLDRDGRVAVAPKYDEITPFSEGLAAVAIDERWGYVDTGGKERIAPQFDDAGTFSEGLAPVRKDQAVGYIDPNGRWVIEPAFRYGAPFAHGVALVVDADKRSRLIDRSGKVVHDFGASTDVERTGDGEHFVVTQTYPAFLLDPQGKRLALPADARSWNSFGDGLLIASKSTEEGSYYGAMDLKGQWVVPPVYAALDPFKQGVAIAARGDKRGVIDTRGQTVVDFAYMTIERGDNGDYLGRTEDGTIDLYDRQGRKLHTAKCAWADLQHEGNWTYLRGCEDVYVQYGDRKPETIKLAEADIKVYGDMLLLSRDGDEDSSAFVLLGPQGRLLSSEDPGIKGQYDRVIPLVGNGPVNTAKPELLPMAILTHEYEKVAVVTRDRRIVTRPEWKYDSDFSDYLYADGPIDGPLIVPTENGVGAVDGNGAWVVEPKFDRLRHFTNGLAYGMLNREFVILDNTGKMQPIPQGFRLDDITGPYTYAMTGEDAEGKDVRLLRDMRTGKTVTQSDTGNRYTRDARDGLVPTRVDDLWGLADAMGNWVLPAQYNGAPTAMTDAQDRLVGWKLEHNDDQCHCSLEGFASPDGRRVILPPAKRDIALNADGLLEITIYPDRGAGRHGLMTRDGRELLPPAFRELTEQGEGWYVVQPEDRKGIVDLKGQWTVALGDYDFSDLQNRPYALEVVDGEERMIHVSGLVSTRAHPQAAPGTDRPQDWISRQIEQDDDPYTVFIGFDWKEHVRLPGEIEGRFFDDVMTIDPEANSGSTGMLVTADGQLIGPLDYVQIDPIREGKAAFLYSHLVKKGKGKPVEEQGVGALDRTGKRIIEPRFEAISAFSQDRAAMILHGNLGVIDAQGQVVVRGAWRCETEPVLIDGKGKIVWPQDGKTKCE